MISNCNQLIDRINITFQLLRSQYIIFRTANNNNNNYTLL